MQTLTVIVNGMKVSLYSSNILGLQLAGIMKVANVQTIVQAFCGLNG